MSDKALEKVDIIDGEVINAPLSDEEREIHHQKIHEIHEAFKDIGYKSLEIWRNLKWIRDNRTYREDYETFNDFCQKELGKDNSQIYRYLKDAEFKEALLLEAGTDEERSSILNLKEGNTRYIRTLPEEAQIPMWKIVYSMGLNVLNKKDDGSIEPTTAFMEAVGSKMNEILEIGGIHIDGEFIPLDQVQASAEIVGVDGETAKAILLNAGVKEEYFEILKRQEQHIREKSTKTDVTSIKGTLELRVDINGSEYPVIIDTKGNELDLTQLLLSFNNRFINLSIKSPIRDQDID